jgi:hypothetical protein
MVVREGGHPPNAIPNRPTPSARLAASVVWGKAVNRCRRIFSTAAVSA